METVEKSKSKSDFSTVSTALGNPAKAAGFPHSHSDGSCEKIRVGARHGVPRPEFSMGYTG
jgi:hypothetical protein